MAQPSLNEIAESLEPFGFRVTKLPPMRWKVMFAASRTSRRIEVRVFTNQELRGFYNRVMREYTSWMLHELPPTIDNAIHFFGEMGIIITQEDDTYWHVRDPHAILPRSVLDSVYTSAEVIEMYSETQKAHKKLRTGPAGR